jgi:hypothetical protein
MSLDSTVGQKLLWVITPMIRNDSDHEAEKLRHGLQTVG